MAQIGLLVGGTAILGMFVWLLFQWLAARRIGRQFKMLPSNPILGHLIDLDGPKAWNYYRKCMGLSSRIFLSYLGPFMSITAIHPDTIAPILGTLEANKKAFNYRFFVPWLGPENMFINHGENWHSVRKTIVSMLKTENLRSYQQNNLSCVTTFVNIWSKRLDENNGVPQVSDLHREISFMAMDVFMMSGYGHNSNFQLKGSNLPDCFGAMANCVWQRTLNPLIWNDFIYSFTGLAREEAAKVKILNEFTRKLLNNRIKDLQEGKNVGMTEDGQPADILQGLLKSNERGRISNEHVNASLVGLILAGYDTSAYSLEFVTWLLAKHPEWQQKCRKEAMAIIGDGNLEFEHLEQLSTIESFIKETIRLYPPVPLIGRTSETEMKLDNKTIPSGLHLEVNIWATHHNPEVWPDPDKFDPTRFSPTKKEQPFAYLTFCAGKRSCPGMKFAMNEMKTFVAMILMKFEITEDPTLPPEPELSAAIMLTPKETLRVKFSHLPK